MAADLAGGAKEARDRRGRGAPLAMVRRACGSKGARGGILRRGGAHLNGAMSVARGVKLRRPRRARSRGMMSQGTWAYGDACSQHRAFSQRQLDL